MTPLFRILAAVVLLLPLAIGCALDDPFSDDSPTAPKSNVLSAFEFQVLDHIVDFDNLSVGASYFEWDFGDGSPVSTDEDPIYEYAESGVYIVELVACADPARNRCDSEEAIVRID